MKPLLLPKKVEFVTQSQLVRFGRVVQEELKSGLEAITLREVVYDYERKQVRARILELTDEIVLWEGDKDFSQTRDTAEMENRLLQVLAGG